MAVLIPSNKSIPFAYFVPMEHLEEDFLPRLNTFTELLKDTTRIHADHISRLGALQKEMTEEVKQLKTDIRLERQAIEREGDATLAGKMQSYEDYCQQMERSLKAYRAIFQQQITDTNFQLGQFATLWGGYLEQIAVQYMLNLLRKEYGVHTSAQRFKRYWHKSMNVEIDLLAQSDTHAYILEVKNQLKEEAFIQMLTILDKIKEHLPEIAHLKLQPVFVCIHATEQIVRTATMAGIWILRYRGFDEQDPSDSFEWLRKEDV